mmetsp:Transcript_18100/g.28626  ORF Transcript_18100/g.28626 Transcript_18100/m.28626 type:complete len:200 (+) Transcript_18100:433-1032(+)
MRHRSKYLLRRARWITAISFIQTIIVIEACLLRNGQRTVCVVPRLWHPQEIGAQLVAVIQEQSEHEQHNQEHNEPHHITTPAWQPIFAMQQFTSTFEVSSQLVAIFAFFLVTHRFLYRFDFVCFPRIKRIFQRLQQFRRQRTSHIPNIVDRQHIVLVRLIHVLVLIFILAQRDTSIHGQIGLLPHIIIDIGLLFDKWSL